MLLPLKKRIRTNLKGAKKVAILGIGSYLNGDDALGLLFIEEVRAILRGTKFTVPVKLFSCGTAPENFTGVIKKFRPSHIIVVDAADMGKKTGSICLVDGKDQNLNVSFSTHGLPFEIFARYIFHYMDTRMIIIGIQAKNLGFGTPVSGQVQKSIKKVASIVKEALLD